MRRRGIARRVALGDPALRRLRLDRTVHTGITFAAETITAGRFS
ncbi:hypothetical protein [Krasilnikovia sp. M28-CT-15]